MEIEELQSIFEITDGGSLRNTTAGTGGNRFGNAQFSSWQRSNKYFGKQFSILGDSISTLDGYNPQGYKVFYTDDNCAESGVITARDTWWGKVIDFFGGELLVNGSWSGSCVTRSRDASHLFPAEHLFPSGCSDERCSSLHISEVKPDVILVYLGTNDWANGVQSGFSTKMLCEDNESFDDAYRTMLRKLKTNYPKSEIWCCTLCETYISKRPGFKFPHKYAGAHIEEYNEIIRDTARKNGCRLIDLSYHNIPYDSMDGSHPNKAGMNTLATLVIRGMIGNEADRFLDCEDGQHELKLIEEFTGGTTYVCSRCGKMVAKMVLPPSKWDHDQKRSRFMNRKISWISGELDEIELVYEKAEADEGIASLLQQLEAQALDEARSNVRMMKTPDSAFLTPERFDFLSEVDKESLITVLGGMGLTSLDIDMESAEIPVKLSPLITKVQACTVFDLLNRLEKLDGAISLLHPKWTLKLRVPLGGRKGLFQWELLIMQLYPWLSVSEEATNEIAVSTNTVPVDPSGSAPTPDPFTPNPNRDIAESDSPPRDNCEYVMLEPGRTVILYSDTLKLTVKDTGKTVQFQKKVVEVGRDTSSDLRLDGKMNVEQHHATFFHEKESWFLRDNFSMAGTWINGNRLQPGKKYQLAANDDISFALAERMTFYDLERTSIPFPNLYADKYVGKIINGKYDVLEKIKEEGYYTVYRVRDLRLDMYWAMKVCDKRSRDYHPVTRNGMITELQMTRKLDHPAIPKPIDLIENEDVIIVLREYIDGKTLESIAKAHGAQPADKVIEWGKQLCSVLGYLHSQNPPYIYRDMKPANVILRPDGRLSVIDFETTRTYKVGQKGDTCCLGTRGYAAPEQFGGSQTDARTDIFGLGMTMYRLVTGINPVEPPYEIKPICSVDPSLPKGLEYIISKCTQPNPDERYRSCEELMADLNNYLNLPKPKGLFGKLFR